MDEERPSQTALGAAIMRALHQTRDHDPQILEDPIATRLTDPESEFYRSRVELLKRLPEPTRLRLEATFVMRSRYTEDCLAEVFGNGVRQYVLLERDWIPSHTGSRAGRARSESSRLITPLLSDGSVGS